MPTQDAKMKLTAVLIADVKGYSRLMGEDEAWATRMLNSYKEILVALFQEYRGDWSILWGTICWPSLGARWMRRSRLLHARDCALWFREV